MASGHGTLCRTTCIIGLTFKLVQSTLFGSGDVGNMFLIVGVIIRCRVIYNPHASVNTTLHISVAGAQSSPPGGSAVLHCSLVCFLTSRNAPAVFLPPFFSPSLIFAVHDISSSEGWDFCRFLRLNILWHFSWTSTFRFKFFFLLFLSLDKYTVYHL